MTSAGPFSDPKIPERIERARVLLATVKHAAMATVNADGTPHNSPYLFMISDDRQHLYWGSHPRSEHSQNILRTGQLFVVVYDAFERGGLYIEADGGHVLEGPELDAGLAAHNAVRRRLGSGEPLTRHYYESSEQRMWGARTQRFWVNQAQRGADGLVVRDWRYEIARDELLPR
jgi:hypothetical protein